MKYDSTNPWDLFQAKPVKIKNLDNPSWDHGYTMSIQGFINESYKKAQDLFRNDKLKPNKWHLIISFSEVLSPDTLRSFQDKWQSICKKLRKRGIEAHGEWEVNRKNQLHTHLLINSKQTKKQVLQILKKCMPYKSGKQDGWRKFIEPVNDNGIIPYVCKENIKEYDEDGNIISYDKYKKKRILFRPGLGLKKQYHIGNYWVDSAAKRKAKQKKINQGAKDSRNMENVEHVFEMVKDDPDVNYYDVKRNICLYDVRNPSKIVATEYDVDLSSKTEKPKMGNTNENQLHNYD